MPLCNKCGARRKNKGRDGNYHCKHCGVLPRGRHVCRAGQPLPKPEDDEKEPNA